MHKTSKIALAVPSELPCDVRISKVALRYAPTTITTLKSASNLSQFQGWIETPTHRAEWLGGNTWALYQRSGKSFVRFGTVDGEKTASIESLLVRHA